MPLTGKVSVRGVLALGLERGPLLGIVGAGGIGFQLIGALRILEYAEMFAIILVILGMVILVDWMGATMRKRFK